MWANRKDDVFARGDAAPSSDFDICLVLGEEPRSDRDRATPNRREFACP